jgi:type I restriction enzyme S subunit
MNRGNLPQLRFSGFVGEWKNEKLSSQVNSISSGKIKPSTEGEFLVYGSTGVIGKTNTFTHNGDYILVARVGANAGQINRAKGKYAVTDNTLIIDLNEDVSVSFCELFLIKFNLNKLIFGSGQPLITGGLLKAIDFTFPSILEQQKIATFLTAVDEKTQQLSRKKELLEQYKKGVMQQLFSGKLRFKEENGKDFGDWEEKKLENFCTFFSGGTPTSTNQKFYSGTIPFIGSGNIYDSEVFSFISEEALNSSSAKIVEKGDLLYALYGANSGELAISKINGAINQAILCIRNKECIQYLYYLLFLNKDNIVAKYLQGGQGNLSSQIIKNLQYKFPTLPEQQKIADFLSNIDTKIQNTNEQITHMQNFKKGLLQQLFV